MDHLKYMYTYIYVYVDTYITLEQQWILLAGSKQWLPPLHETWFLQFSTISTSSHPQLQACPLSSIMFSAWLGYLSFQLLVKTSHGIPKLEKMPLVWPPHKTRQKESLFTSQVSSSWMTPSIWTLSGRSVHYLVRQLTIAAAIVMTTNDIYDMIQKFQNAFSCLITATNLRTTYCHPHFTGEHIEKLRDLSKDVEFKVRFSDVKVHAFLVWNISKHNKSTNSCKKHAGTHPRDYALASELPSLCTVSLMSVFFILCHDLPFWRGPDQPTVVCRTKYTIPPSWRAIFPFILNEYSWGFPWFKLIIWRKKRGPQGKNDIKIFDEYSYLNICHL